MKMHLWTGKSALSIGKKKSRDLKHLSQSNTYWQNFINSQDKDLELFFNFFLG